jgi:transmembrane sensor
MIERESAADIEAQAVRWVVRADQGELTGVDRTVLEAWLAGDPADRAPLRGPRPPG